MTGILSLITWALLLVVAVKYVMIIMRAYNHGEGGVFALTALVSRHLGKGNAGVERARPERRCKALGWEVLLNRAGTTFRKLPERDKQVDGSDAAIALMLAQPSMIKRPVPERDGDRRVGGKPEIDQRSFQRPAANRR